MHGLDTLAKSSLTKAVHWLNLGPVVCRRTEGRPGLAAAGGGEGSTGGAGARALERASGEVEVGERLAGWLKVKMCIYVSTAGYLREFYWY